MQQQTVANAPAQTHSVAGDFVVRRGTFFQIGDYPDKQFALTEAEADAAIARFAPVPLNVEHIPTIFDGKLGTVRRLWREGKNILAEYVIPRWLHEVTRGEAIKISSEWSRQSKTAQGGAFVLNPRVADAVMLAAFHHIPAGRQALSAQSDVSNVQMAANPCSMDAARDGKEWERMSLLTGIKALFQRVGLPAQEIDAQLNGLPANDSVFVSSENVLNAQALPMTGEAAAPQRVGENPAGVAEPPAVSSLQTGLPGSADEENARFAVLEAELARLRQTAQTAQEEALAAQDAARFAADTQIIDGWVRGMQMAPAEAEQWRLIAQATPAVFAAAVPALNARAALPQLAGFGGATIRASETADAGRLEALTRQRMKDRNMDYTAAFKEVCGENRELALSVRMKSQEGN